MKKKIKKFAGYVCIAAVAVVTAITNLVSSASAAVDLTAFTVDVSGPETLAGIVLTGLAAMWAIRKLVKLINRS
ncbi:hypothetical protein ACFLZG_02070 [Thermodesulfobacteriota bacterium]